MVRHNRMSERQQDTRQQVNKTTKRQDSRADKGDNKTKRENKDQLFKGQQGIHPMGHYSSLVEITILLPHLIIQSAKFAI